MSKIKLSNQELIKKYPNTGKVYTNQDIHKLTNLLINGVKLSLYDNGVEFGRPAKDLINCGKLIVYKWLDKDINDIRIDSAAISLESSKEQLISSYNLFKSEEGRLNKPVSPEFNSVDDLITHKIDNMNHKIDNMNTKIDLILSKLNVN